MSMPDAYIPLYGIEFLAAVEGHSDAIGMGYLRAIVHYWSHTHCTGLKDEQEFLRRLCRIDREDWEAAMAIIFDNDRFFTLGEDGKWHQKRAAQEWAKSLAAYQARVENGRKGGLAKSAGSTASAKGGRRPV